MKIGIVTNYSNLNYGSALQAVALQYVLRSMKHSPEHINWDRTGGQRSYLRRIIRDQYNALIGRNVSKTRGLIDSFRRFRCSHLAESPLIQAEDFRSLNLIYDAFICGSDQIWAPNQFNPAFFLDFVSDNAKKIAYAPSIGLPQVPEALQESYRRLIRSIPHCSIREEQGAELLLGITGKKIPVVLDPTLLLTKTEWLTYADKPKPRREKYILCYFLGNNPRHYEAARKLANNLDCALLRAVLRPKEVKPHVRVEDLFLSPSAFLRYIALSEGVVTDSFHGTVFSILFEKPFWTFERFGLNDPLNQNSRVASILSKFGLDSRLQNFNQDHINNKDAPIDYEVVGKILNEERQVSRLFLANSLNAVTGGGRVVVP